MSGTLDGCRVVVCRSVEQAGPLLSALRAAGARPLPLPLIEVAPPVDGGSALGAAVDELARYRWVALTSSNGVRALAGALGGRPWPPGVQVATVGPATTAACGEAGIPVALARPGGTAVDLAAALPAPPAGGGSVLLPVAELAGPGLAELLLRAGWQVDQVVAYRTVRPPVAPEVVAAAVAADAVAFTSASTVDRFVEVAGDRWPPLVVCIGPSTARRAEDRGMAVTAVAADQSDEGLVRAVASVWAPRG